MLEELFPKGVRVGIKQCHNLFHNMTQEEKLQELMDGYKRVNQYE